MKKINVAIIGASGYTGVELIRILLNHPNVNISNLVANSNSNQNISDIYGHLSNFDLPILKKLVDVDFSLIDLVFSCLPHATSHEIILDLYNKYKNLKIIDLSADFRIDDKNDYKEFYQHEHKAFNIQKEAIYGLCEINRNKIKKSRLIASPGCYPTSALLPLIPLLKNKLIKPENIIIDSKSGTSGAGRSLKQNILFCEVNNSVKAYSIGSHRHICEMEQELSKVSESKVFIDFTPHLLPVNRGIISTIYCDLNKDYAIEDTRNCLETIYHDEYFVNILNKEVSISDVVGTNFCNISVNKSRSKNKITIVSVIDNLCKGASGQAVQSMNILFGFDEKMGLAINPIFP